MQQLQNASDPLPCAASVFEAALDVMLLIRETTARRHHDRPSLIHVRAMGTLRKRPGATLSDLSQHLALTPSATSRLVECLVGKGLVERIVPAGNRRVVSLRLTAAGRKSLTKSLHLAQCELAKPLEKLTAAQRAALGEAMALLSETLAAAARDTKVSMP
jgi:DNA-binding MarR family transcriptional regulator